MDSIIKLLEGSGLNLRIKHNVSGKALTTFKSGGAVKFLIEPLDTDSAVGLYNLFQREGIKHKILGGGSNTLISDKGVEEPVVRLRALRGCRVERNFIYAEAGAMLPELSKLALYGSLTGLEFAVGIPATAGGATVSNAGAYGGEIGKLIQWVDVIEDGKQKRLLANDLQFSYRQSNLKDKIILAVMLNLDYAEQDEVRERMEELALKRRFSQPVLPSAGSVFKKVNDTPAAVYIDQLGLKGKRVGDAEISQVHANFICNTGGATTANFLDLAEQTAELVEESYSVKLIKEVQLIE